MSRLTNYERETMVNFNEAESAASVYTHNKALRRRLAQLAQERPEECRLVKITRWGEAAEYCIPKSWVKIKPPRILTEEQRLALVERGKNSVLFKNSRTTSGGGALAPGSEGRDTTPTPGA